MEAYPHGTGRTGKTDRSFFCHMPLRRKRKSKTTAPAIVYFTQARNEKGVKQLCVFAECLYGGSKAGPVWSHSDAAVGRALATLTQHCDCGRYFHKRRRSEGQRVLPKHHS